MPDADILIPSSNLTAFAASLLDAVGVAPNKSKLVAESLVAANLRGVDSHGVQLLPYYIEQLEWGDMDLHADGRVISESGACLLYDGQNGIGQPIAETCCAHAVRIARANGVGMVVARESNKLVGHDATGTGTEARFDLVEDERGYSIGVAEHRLQREHQA